MPMRPSLSTTLRWSTTSTSQSRNSSEPILMLSACADVGRLVALVADAADVSSRDALEAGAVGDGTADHEAAGSGVDLQAGVVVVQFYVEAKGADMVAVAHEADEWDAGGGGVGDESAGFVGLRHLLFHVVRDKSADDSSLQGCCLWMKRGRLPIQRCVVCYEGFRANAERMKRDRFGSSA